MYYKMSFQFDTYPNNPVHALYGSLSLCIFMAIPLIGRLFFWPVLPLLWIPLITIFLWPRQADRTLSILLLFALGILYDTFTGVSFGLSSFSFLCIYMFSQSQFGVLDMSFALVWWHFIQVMVLFMVIIILILYTFYQSWMFTSVLAHGSMVIFLFPLFYTGQSLIRTLATQDMD